MSEHDTCRVDALMAKWDDDGATRGSAFVELRDLARELEREVANWKSANRLLAASRDRWKLCAGNGLANDGKEPDWNRYAKLEKEQLGDIDSGTGIYHPENRAANSAPLIEPVQVAQHIVSVLSVLVDKVRNAEDCGPSGQGWQSSELEKAIAEADAIIASIRGVHQARTQGEGGGA